MLKLFTCLLLLCCMVACNPAKRVAKQKAAIDKLKSELIAEYVKANPCPQLPLIDLDSLCQQIGYSYGDVLFDTTTERSASENSASVPDSSKHSCAPCKPKHILVPGPPDERMIRLLNDSLAAVRMQLAYCNGLQKGTVNPVVKQSEWKWNRWSSLSVALLLLNIIVFILLIRSKR